jgi:hypothetical protein
MINFFDRFIDWILSAIKSHFISKEDINQKHLDDIKKEVLEPMLRILDETYIPVLEGKNTIIKYTAKNVWGKGVDVRQHSGELKFDLEIISPESENRTNWNIPPPKINQNLYRDIKENHYIEFINNIEKLQSGFIAFGNKWLSYAVEIQNIIEKEITLPLFDGDNAKESFVNSKALAGFIIEKINGINPSPVGISEGRNSISLPGWTFSEGSYPTGLTGKPEEVKKCIDLVNRLIADDKKYAELHPEQEKLLKSANFLRSELDQIIKTYKLRGKCKYV